MKILFVLRNLRVGGTTFVLRAAQGLIARGHEIDPVLTHFSDDLGRAGLEWMCARIEKNHSQGAVAARLESIYQLAQGAKTGAH